MKFNNDPLALTAAAHLLAMNVSAHLQNNAMIVPIPISFARYLQRGFNQSLSLADGLSKATGLPLEALILRRIKHRKPQSKLSSQDRKNNLAGAFRAKSLTGAPSLVVVDDVITTGATIEHAVTALKRAGAGRVTVCALAAST